MRKSKKPNISAKEQQSPIDKKYLDPQYSVSGDEDDESGGGHGKSKLNNFKLEKLLHLLDKGLFKAKDFWRFLNREGLDAYEISKSELDKQVEAKEEKSSIEERITDEKQQIDKVKSLSEKERKEAKSDASKNTSRYQVSKEHLRFSFLDDNANADSVRRNIIGDKIAGSITSGTTNPLGLSKQVDIVGTSIVSPLVNEVTRRSIFAQQGAAIKPDYSNSAQDKSIRASAGNRIFNAVKPQSSNRPTSVQENLNNPKMNRKSK